MKITTITAMALCLLASSANAQFLKKIAKGAERAVFNSAAEKAMEGMMSTDGFGGAVDPSVLPASYAYNWRYTLRMEHEEGTMDIHYHLRPNGTDFASRMEMEQQTMMGGMLTVMDQQRGVVAILMEMQGNKAGQVMAMDNGTLDSEAAQNEMGDMEFKEIGTKKILGHTCHGYRIENDDMTMTMYVAFDTPVSMNKVTAQELKRMPKGFNPKWMDKLGKENLMMEMQMVHKRKKKHNATITCVALEEEPMTIAISEYDFSFQKALQRQ
ncbi:DUF4412 domain-containing protein [Maribacter sp. 2307ULW6-5]|uniref:DUF4412 domain-containing protein n=1 Tax=Maribacter sp. 2307ULW6-5 TaxID=3386275 RepID=UPI0039BC266C